MAWLLYKNEIIKQKACFILFSRGLVVYVIFSKLLIWALCNFDNIYISSPFLTLCNLVFRFAVKGTLFCKDVVPQGLGRIRAPLFSCKVAFPSNWYCTNTSTGKVGPEGQASKWGTFKENLHAGGSIGVMVCNKSKQQMFTQNSIMETGISFYFRADR